MFKKLLILTTLLLTACSSTAQELEGPKAQLYSKPVICATELEQSMDMLAQVKKDGMLPLMYFYGNSFNGDGSKFNADFFILYDPTDQQITVVERQGPGGFTCIISGGTGQVEFDPTAIKAIMGWSDIK